MIKALFLDRDGTINVDYGYVGSVERFKFIDGIFDFCRYAEKLNYDIIVITNQSGIARGYFSEYDLKKVNEYMCKEFLKQGIKIKDIFYCPYLSGPDRKPNPGMFFKAQKKYDIDMAKSVSVGDKDRDIEAAKKAGVLRNFLFKNNYKELERKL